jgi:hypothetical protein
MTSGFKHFEGIAQSRFHKHRSGLRRSPSIYQTFEIGDSVEKALGSRRHRRPACLMRQALDRFNESPKNLLELKGIGY